MVEWPQSQREVHGLFPYAAAMFQFQVRWNLNISILCWKVWKQGDEEFVAIVIRVLSARQTAKQLDCQLLLPGRPQRNTGGCALPCHGIVAYGFFGVRPGKDRECKLPQAEMKLKFQAAFRAIDTNKSGRWLSGADTGSSTSLTGITERTTLSEDSSRSMNWRLSCRPSEST